jgi:hypothetical protein
VESRTIAEDDPPSEPQHKPRSWWRKCLYYAFVTLTTVWVCLAAAVYVWSWIDQILNDSGKEDTKAVPSMQAAVKAAGWELVVQPTESSKVKGVITYTAKVKFGACKITVVALSTDPQNVDLRVIESPEPIDFDLEKVPYAALRAKAENYGLAHCHPPTLD